MLLTSGKVRPRVVIALLALSSVAAARGVAAQQEANSTGLSRAVARSIPATPDSRHVFVLDSAHLLTAPEIAALQDSALKLQAATGADIAFVTLPTLHGGAVEEAALAIGRAWKVGSAGAPGDPTRNRGLVMLYVPDKKSVAGANLRVEVGRGLEGAITDGGGAREILEAIKPPFRAKRYGDGFIAAFNVAAALIIAEQPSATLRAEPPPAQEADEFPWPLVVLIVPAALFIIAAIIVRRRRGTRPTDLTPHDPSPANVAEVSAPTQVHHHSPPVSSSHISRRKKSGDSDSGSSNSGSSSGGSSSGGGSFGGGGGFSGGGSSDSV